MTGPLEGTLGSLMVGVLVSNFLSGIATVQAYIYFRTFPHDLLRLKVLVAVVWLLDLGHTFCISYGMYHLAIMNYGDSGALLRVPSLAAFDISLALGGLIAQFVQAYFASRVYVFSGKLYVPILCWILLSLTFLGIIVLSAMGFKVVFLTKLETELGWLMTSDFTLGAIADMIISISLLYYMRQQRVISTERTGLLLDVLIKWTMQTAAVTSVARITLLISFQTLQGTFMWATLLTVLAKFYSNSFLAILNGRMILRRIDKTQRPIDSMLIRSPTVNTRVQTAIFSNSSISPQRVRPPHQVILDCVGERGGQATRIEAHLASLLPSNH